MIQKNTDEFEEIRNFYDAEYYARASLEKTSLSWHSRLVGGRLKLPQNAEVLDVACGLGEWLGYFQSRGAQVSGIDISSSAISICEEKFPDGEFHCGPAEELPFPNASFDLVTCMGSLEHFLDKPQALESMLRVARPGASIIILVPNAGFLTRRLGLYGGTNQVKVREDVLELEQWQKLFEDAGMLVCDYWRDLHPLSWRWIRMGKPIAWPLRLFQALALSVWPLAWQYQVYFHCKKQ